jgi:hypothetical protein
MESREGLHLRIEAENARIDVRLNHVLIGRLWFGPSLAPRMVGGRAEELWLRPDVLTPVEEQHLELEIVGTGDGQLSADRLVWQRSPHHPAVANATLTVSSQGPVSWTQ